METHVKILGGLYIALGIIGVVASIVILALFGGLAALIGADHDPDGPAAAAMFGVLGTIGFVVMLAASLPTIFTGFGLLKFRPWAQTLAIVIAIINLLSFPFGTAIGVYALWVLFNSRTKPLFRAA